MRPALTGSFCARTGSVVALVALCLSAPRLFAADMLNLAKAVVVADQSAKKPGPQAAAVRMLVDEVQKRTQIAWPVAGRWTEPSLGLIVVGLPEFVKSALAQRGLKGPPYTMRAAEGYEVRVIAADKLPVIAVTGSDPRGVLFGVGRLLRELRMGRQRIELPADLQIAAAPRYPLRGHQL